mmetsp:Transcript_43882/g.92320  ORF Transcript_43882/g.92320 Transcript_43882/m.92320 type:complete len:279 (-) Transcript_43882:188-1024(-)|eukprot:CAMPEP_0183728490 /NCGR_PEP_ID=MMETSP0737-20130205/28177_1 /TAXON_ID=385413 /ORGANISM="Thalassiosira miniscula, Strain CCMP1093" /LENGTH=278 /DNA_ID=CAMNT_0025960443 /DNA_START=294 /DNA_END=1130 /DNA_ORIENTATION=+
MAGTETEGTTAVAPSKSPMEESANALAGIDGALTGSKRKTAAAAAASPAKKKVAKTAIKPETKQRPRSNSIEQLAEVAGSLLKDDGSAAKGRRPAAGPGASSVPDPMANVATAIEAASAAAVSLSIAASTAATVPTGFRKKAPAKAPAPAATAATSTAPSAPPPPSKAIPKSSPDSDDGLNKQKKTQITYNPDIPMTKEQLTAWRREMRRVRNRESAAASRRKVRDRIEELEDEVALWKKRYQEVQARLAKANNEKGVKNNGKSEEKGNEGKDDQVQI